MSNVNNNGKETQLQVVEGEKTRENHKFIQKLRNFEKKYLETLDRIMNSKTLRRYLAVSCAMLLTFSIMDVVAVKNGGYSNTATPMENAVIQLADSIDVVFGTRFGKKVSEKVEDRFEKSSNVPVFVEDKFSNFPLLEGTTETVSSSDIAESEMATEMVSQTSEGKTTASLTTSKTEAVKVVMPTAEAEETTSFTGCSAENDMVKHPKNKNEGKTIWVGRPHFAKKDAVVDNEPVVETPWYEYEIEEEEWIFTPEPETETETESQYQMAPAITKISEEQVECESTMIQAESVNQFTTTQVEDEKQRDEQVEDEKNQMEISIADII